MASLRQKYRSQPYGMPEFAVFGKPGSVPGMFFAPSYVWGVVCATARTRDGGAGIEARRHPDEEEP